MNMIFWWFVGILLGLLFSLIVNVLVRTGIMIVKSIRAGRIPVQTVPVRIIRKRTKPEQTEKGETYTACYMTFESAEGTVTELKVSQDFYAAFRENTYGDLTHQGSTFLAFAPQAQPVVPEEEPAAQQRPAEPLPAADDFDPALFVRHYPEPEGQSQMNGL